MNKKDNMENKGGSEKKFSIKDIGLPKLLTVFVAGILLLILSFPNMLGTKNSPTSSNSNNQKYEQKDTNMTSQDVNTYITSMESKLENILKKVSGMGDVEVMITLKSSKEKVTLKDTPNTQESINEVDGEGGSRINNNVQREESTVLVTTENGKTEPYIIQEIEPEVEGVMVIAEGGDDVKIIKDIMDAAEVLFNVPAHKVKVMKMNDGINK